MTEWTRAVTAEGNEILQAHTTVGFRSHPEVIDSLRANPPTRTSCQHPIYQADEHSVTGLHRTEVFPEDTTVPAKWITHVDDPSCRYSR